MARNKNTTAHLRSTTRGASLTEYTVLTGLLGAVALGAVLAFGINVQDNTEEIQTRVDSVVALANSGAPSGGGSGGTGTGGTGTGGTGAQTPPVDVFASCETGFGPNPAAIRGNGDGSLLSGGNNNQVIYALANGLVDGGEGGTDLDVLMVPGAGAVATFNGTNPESGRVDVGTGSVVFSNIEMVILCDAGGEAVAPDPLAVLDTFGFVFVWDEAFPDRSAVIPHIATAGEPFNPFAEGVGVFHQTHTANGTNLLGTSLYAGGPLLDEYDVATSEAVFTPAGSTDQFVFPFDYGGARVAPLYAYWLPTYEGLVSGETTGTMETPEDAAAAATASLGGVNMCIDFQPVPFGEGPALDNLVQKITYWSPVVGAPAGRHIFQVVCSRPELAGDVSGAFVPLVGGFYPFD